MPSSGVFSIIDLKPRWFWTSLIRNGDGLKWYYLKPAYLLYSFTAEGKCRFSDAPSL